MSKFTEKYDTTFIIVAYTVGVALIGALVALLAVKATI